MVNVSLKVAYSIIITGLFIIVVFVATFYQVLDPNFYLVLIPLTAFLFLFGFAIGQKFAFPVKKLLKEADYLSKGNFKSRFYVANKDELGELAGVLNKIAQEFEESKNKIGALDNKVKLRTKASEEIINVLEQKIKNRTFDFQRAVEDSEKLRETLLSRNEEILSLQGQIAELSKKKRKKKVT